jgi:1-acyl-sn-glycerol-3-phosphate acyltransferase
MDKFLSWLGVIYFFLSSAVLFAIGAFICLSTFWFDRNRRLLHYYASWWGYHYMQLNWEWKVRFEGRELIDPKKTYVIVANHQSFIDILVLYGLFKPYKWVSKESVSRVPFVGWNMLINQYVFIKRGDMKSIKEMMQTCRNWLKRGASLLMFPEGTRSEDGEIHDFRDGPFRLAAEAGVPVVPVIVNGTHEILPKNGKSINYRAHVLVKVLPPVDPAAFNNKSAAVRDHVQALMKASLAEMRGEKAPVLLAPGKN